MRHKSNILALFLLAAVAAGLTACVNDPVVEPGEPGSGEETVSGVRYLSLRVGTADSDNLEAIERAAETGSGLTYEGGTEFEHAVDFTGESENVLIFLDKNWSYKGYSLLSFDRNSAQGTPGSSYAEAAYIGFLRPTDFSEVYKIPEYGMVVLNASRISEALDKLVPDGSTIDDVLKLIDQPGPEEARRAGRSGNYFTMTSTAYLVKETNTWKHSVVFEIDRDKIFDTRIQAVISPAAEAVVERMSAKFSLSLPGAVKGQGVHFLPDNGRAQVIVCHYIDGQPYYDNRTWTCSVTAWGINKYEPGSYYFRNIIGEGARTEQYPYTYDEDINTTYQPFFNGWNNAAHHRTFWAVDPHYTPKSDDKDEYPTQYRPAVDNPYVPYYKEDKVSLAYVSYNELSTDLRALEKAGESATLYTPENTFPGNDRISGHWQHELAGSEVVIGAQIHVNGIDETLPDYDLYRNRIGVFYPSTTDFAAYFISTINTQLASQSNMTYRYYDWSNPDANGSETVMKTFRVDNSGYKLYYEGTPLTAERMASLNKQTIPATIENGDGKVIPWISGLRIGWRKINPDTYEEEGPVQYLTIAENDFKSLIYDWIGSFDHFNRGRMVYSIPIRYRASKEQVTTNNYKPTVGDYGVVRNAWYRIVIEGINSLGTPVDDPDQKIIPYEASLENSLLMEINVLDWHGFSTEVTLPDHVK